jgi:hypothetical protein
MRISLAGILWFSSLACLAQTHQQVSRPVPQDGGVREVLESITIPPISHAPFFATLDTEWVKYAADGATITLANERHIARDAQGRVYQERWFLVPKNGPAKSTMNWIQLADPKQHTLYNCSTEKHVCELLTYEPAEDSATIPAHKATSMQLPNGDGIVTWEELGGRDIAGMETVGTRETTIRNAGTMGNDQPLTFMSEYWHSDQLGINLLSIRSSPFFGKQIFTITDLTPGDPDPKLFELPAGFTVQDQRKNPPISH